MGLYSQARGIKQPKLNEFCLKIWHNLKSLSVFMNFVIIGVLRNGDLYGFSRDDKL